MVFILREFSFVLGLIKFCIFTTGRPIPKVSQVLQWHLLFCGCYI